MQGNQREGSLAVDHEGQAKKALEMGISFHRDPGGGLIHQGLWELDEGALGMKHLSLHRLCVGGLGGSSFIVDPGRNAKKVSRYRHLSPWGPLSI